jgi:histone-lysine N-methyltransferase SETD2
VLENLLRKRGYIYDTQTDPDTEEMEMIFFVHPKSYEMWRAFPHVLLIDATYKTNKYKFPFVQVVGLTSTGKSVSVAHAFIQKERAPNYKWVLGKLRDMLGNCMEPRVIVTDRDLALMNAVQYFFPAATRCLCRWHIVENIGKYYKKSFNGKNWERFQHYWTSLCNSESEAKYDYNVGRLRRFLRTQDQECKLLTVMSSFIHNYYVNLQLYELSSSH